MAILRLIKHIPEKHFRMVRYFGFLANRVVGKLLPLVRKALGQDNKRVA
ncbi:transposase [Symbiopectobacterium purcellii]